MPGCARSSRPMWPRRIPRGSRSGSSAISSCFLPAVPAQLERAPSLVACSLCRPGNACRRSLVAVAHAGQGMGLQVRSAATDRAPGEPDGPEVSEAPPERYVEYTNTRTGETMDVPVGVHPAFNYRPGLRRESLGRALMDKADTAEPRTAARMLADGADQWAPLVQAEFDDFVGRYTAANAVRPVSGAWSVHSPATRSTHCRRLASCAPPRSRHDSCRHGQAAQPAGRGATNARPGHGHRRRARRAVANAVAPGR